MCVHVYCFRLSLNLDTVLAVCIISLRASGLIIIVHLVEVSKILFKILVLGDSLTEFWEGWRLVEKLEQYLAVIWLHSEQRSACRFDFKEGLESLNHVAIWCS